MTLLQRLTSDGPKRILALDGGVSMANNPALQLFPVATLTRVFNACREAPE
jgi:hypothetical protein